MGTAQKKETVELIKPHTHAGVRHDPAASAEPIRLDLKPRQAKWLIEAGVAKAAARREV